MINALRYAVTFPTNGITLSGQHCFQPGATAVSGRNGTGKSFIAEMIRYGMFGKKALRGPATDYKKLDMELGFLDYHVSRGKKETLTKDGETLAVGADAVNKKIIEILGFGLEVFDVVCSANQKESERLTRLTPVKRKELIDDVVGLTQQEAVEKACRDEANALRREAEALTRALVLPVEPEKPVNYQPSKDLAEELRVTKDTLAKIASLQRVIDAVGVAPEKPLLAVPNIAEIEAHEKARTERDAHRAAVERQIGSIPDATVSIDQIEAAELLAEYDAALRARGPEPTLDLTAGQIEAMLETWSVLSAHDNVIGQTVVCPHCGMDFDTNHDLPLDPPHSKKELEQELRRLENWASVSNEPAGERMSAREIQQARVALDRAGDKAKLQEELGKLTLLDDRSAELREARRIDTEWTIYERDQLTFSERYLAGAKAKLELAAIDQPKHSIADLDAAFVAARVYESQIDNYDTAKAKFDELSAEIVDKAARADGFLAGAKGLVEARRTLKAFLAPSLSRVSSAIISQMTVNARRPLTQIVVDEDMNISVDGQDVSTFNGAHATMINLALRMALGQVLVSRVMPLFIGDEIDSDLDTENAQALADALLALKDQLKQVVIISHKRLENFDHDITL